MSTAQCNYFKVSNKITLKMNAADEPMAYIIINWCIKLAKIKVIPM